MNVIIYSKDNCSHCTRAKTTLINKNIPYQEFKLGEDFTREYILEQYPTAKTFPIVVVDGFYIGGADQLQETLNKETNNGKLLVE